MARNKLQKLACDYVLEHVDPSDYVRAAPDQLAAEVYEAGLRKGLELAAAVAVEWPGGRPMTGEWAKGVADTRTAIRALGQGDGGRT